MRPIRRPIVRTGSLLLFIALAISVIAGCGNSTVYVTVTPTPKTPLKTPNDPKPVTVVKGQATTLDLGGGADLIIPPGAMTPGATVSATYKGRPDGNWTNIAPTFSPVELISNPPDAIHGLLTLEFPVAADQITPGVDPAVQFGVSTYDPATKTWTPFESTYDSARHMIVALIPHFSWWNPFTWDFDALFANIAQGFGQITGARAGKASCSGSLPTWVRSMAGVSNDADVAIHSCGKAKGNVLDIEIVNNRPYGQVLTYGGAVQWGWHDSGQSISQIALDHFMDANMLPTQLYLPPLTRASVGIFEPKSATNMIFHIGPTRISIGADFLFYILGQGVDAIPYAGKCTSMDLQAPIFDKSVSALRDDLVEVAGCVEQTFTNLVKSGALDKVKGNTLAALFGKIKGASLLANGIAIAGGVTWKIADLVADWIVNGNSMLGNGFSVYANPNASNPPPPPPTVTPAPPHPNPTPTPAPPHPQPTPTHPPTQTTYPETAGSTGGNTFTNPANAGAPLGQRVGDYQTIRVSCRLTGWKAQDGNTWWYRIASSPWNNAFYAPADNYYNNGATSGSLIGTPFVDTKVPMC